MKNFAMLGIGGYIAPRHLKAIADTGNQLVVAVDPSDSVGVIDSYFPHCHFFTDFEHFDNFASSAESNIDYVVVCSPNYLHEAHISWGLRRDKSVICEKPLVLDSASAELLKREESKSKGKVFSILQLRHHSDIINLKSRIDDRPGKRFDVELTYITSRGRWYDRSWKGDDTKSGGVIMNIGIHFFDMLGFLFGKLERNTIHKKDKRTCGGYLEFERARVRWFLSVDEAFLPDEILARGQRTYRNIMVDGEPLEFSGGFTDLHTTSYLNILSGNGFGLSEAEVSIALVDSIRQGATQKAADLEIHPFCKSADTIL